MGFAIKRPDTAFSNAPVGKQAKRKRQKNDAHLEWIRTLPCTITGAMPVEAAHVRFASRIYGKRATGAGEKPDDQWSLPLSPAKHREQHGMDEERFWLRYGIDPLQIAAALWANSGDDDQGRLILSEARSKAATFRLWSGSQNQEVHDAE
jgi:hypothetical protein